VRRLRRRHRQQHIIQSIVSPPNPILSYPPIPVTRHGLCIHSIPWPLCCHQAVQSCGFHKFCSALCFACFFFHSPYTVVRRGHFIWGSKNKQNNSESGFSMYAFSTGDSPIWKEHFISVCTGTCHVQFLTDLTLLPTVQAVPPPKTPKTLLYRDHMPRPLTVTPLSPTKPRDSFPTHSSTILQELHIYG
jgi:hypothetical protein